MLEYDDCTPPTDNLKLWNQVCQTDPKYTKEVRLGSYKFTDIDNMYSIRRATELWGPYGSTWGIKELDVRDFSSWKDGSSVVVGVYITAMFFYPGGQFSIAADMPYEPKGETLKKLQTMCIGKALSRLGFSADVYLGMFDDSAYVKEMEEKYAAATDNSGGGNTVGSGVTDKPVESKKEKVKKYPEPDPVAAGILGSMSQKYMEYLHDHAEQYPSMIVNFKKVCNAVYDTYGQYPTKLESIPKMMLAIAIENVIEKNDFLEGLT